jgi:NitT/TauT family transport system permease protein
MSGPRHPVAEELGASANGVRSAYQVANRPELASFDVLAHQPQGRLVGVRLRGEGGLGQTRQHDLRDRNAILPLTIAFTVSECWWDPRGACEITGHSCMSFEVNHMAVAQQVEVAPSPDDRDPVIQIEVRKRRGASRDRLIGAAGVIVVLGVWQLVVDVGLVGSYLLVAPTTVATSLWNLFTKQNMLMDVRVSAYQFAIGYLAAVIVGVVVGMLVGWYRNVASATQPLISALYSTPRIALIPLFVVWFGVGNDSKIVIVFIEAVFQILLSVVAGVRATDEQLLAVARSFGASEWQIFTTVVLPGAVPFLISGLRLAVGTGIVGMVVGEMLAGTAGIGYVIQNAGATFQIGDIFAGVAIIAVSAAIMMALLRRLERRFDAWRPTR